MSQGLVLHLYKAPGETRLIPMIAHSGIDLMVNPGEVPLIALVSVHICIGLVNDTHNSSVI